MHPILILVLAVPILIGTWMIVRGMRTSTREQKLSVFKWLFIIGLFGISAYLAWSGLWRHALGVLGSLFLFAWNWRRLLVWFAGNAVKKRMQHKVYGGNDTQQSMKPARKPGQRMPDEHFTEMSQKEALDILGLPPKYTETDVNVAWETMLRKLQDSDDTGTPPHPTSLINAVHQARAVLLETLA